MSVLWLVVLLDRAYDQGTEGYMFTCRCELHKHVIGRTLERDEVPDIESV